MALRSYRRYLLAHSLAKINTHFACLQGCSALPLGLKQTIVPSPLLRIGLPGQGMVFHAALTPVGNSQQLQIAVVGKCMDIESTIKMAMCVKNKGLFKQHFMFTYDH